MANLTVTVDEETLRRARMRALEQGTSVNALVREYLESYADDEAVRETGRRIAEHARSTHAGSGPGGRTWTREELYEDRLVRRDEPGRPRG